jgi:hypothetical protein
VFTSADCFFCDLILDSIRRRGRRELGENKPFYHSPIDRIVRYQTMINRQLYQAINQLERLQRLRKGDNVPAPLNVQVSHDAPTTSEEQ